MSQKHANARIEREADRVEERSTPPATVIYETVRRFGEDEMARPDMSLWWSGLAAGLSLSFSLLAQALLLTHLPDASWRPIVVALGYPLGFIMVVLARQQLFTEATITVVVPVMARPDGPHFLRAARVWLIVLVANLAGTLLAALFCHFTPVLQPETLEAMREISRQTMHNGWLQMAFGAIPAGFLMAAMVWLLPAADAAQFHIVVILTYVIGIGGFPHIVAGSMEAFLLLVNGDHGISATLWDFGFPVLLGNIVGGTALFALISHAQVMKER